MECFKTFQGESESVSIQGVIVKRLGLRWRDPV